MNTRRSRFSPAQVVAVLGPYLGPERAGRLDRVAEGRLGGVAVLLEDLRDPHNLGAVLRSCEAFGVMGVHVVSSEHRFRTSTRVTQGSEKWLALERWTDVEASARELQRRGYRLLCGAPDATETVDAIDPRAPVALAFGNEHTGLSPRLLALADGRFRIPMEGFSQSLNVSVSVAVSLYTVTRARRRALGRPGDLDEEAVLGLRARYYAIDVRAADAILERALGG